MNPMITPSECGLSRLCTEYDAFQRQHGLTLGSADEHHHDHSLTEEQRTWLKDFSRRWEEQADSNRDLWFEDETFKSHGFSVRQTGGGCTAWGKDLADSRYILITDSEGLNHRLGDRHVDLTSTDKWLVGLHDEKGAVPDAHSEHDTAAEACAAAEGFASRAEVL